MIKLSPNFMDNVTFGPLVVKNQNCMHFVEEHCFGCSLDSPDADENGYPTAHETFTTKRRDITSLWKGSQAV